MNRPTRLSRKKEYIRWFIRSHYLKSPEAKDILHFFIENPHILRRIHFVEKITNYSNAVIISADNTDTPPYILRLNNQYFSDIKQFIAQLKISLPPSLFVWLSFDREYLCSFCNNILESPPALPIYSIKQAISSLEKELSKKILDREKLKKKILYLIDKALDEGDQKLFLQLSSELKEIN